jgi:malonyl-CoA O-methyltransferase
MPNILHRLRALLTLHPTAHSPVLPSTDAYARWAGSYPSQAHNALMRAEEAALLALLPVLAGQRVLDLACGSGRYGRLALAQGAAQVIGTDNSIHMLREAALPARALADVDALPLPAGSVDVVLCGLALGHVREIAPALREIGRVLCNRGVALVSDVHPFLFLNGAQRTFTHEGKTFAVEHYVHLYSDYHAAAQAGGLRLDAVVEPRLLPADRTGGAPNAPVAVVYRFVKG